MNAQLSYPEQGLGTSGLFKCSSPKSDREYYAKMDWGCERGIGRKKWRKKEKKNMNAIVL